MHITVIGTGIMGASIVERLAACGHDLTIYNRTKEKAEALRDRGVTVAQTVQEAVEASPLILLTLTDAMAIHAALFFHHQKPTFQGRTLVQMGTIAPSESRDIAQRVENEGGEYFEAPVLGSKTEAKGGNLLIMVGGSHDSFERWRTVLADLGDNPRLIGPVGKASAMKLAFNQLIAAHIAAFSLSLGFIQQSGVPVEDFMNLLRDSTLFAPMFEKKLPRLLDRNYENPNFPTTHLLKDVQLFLKEAKDMGLETVVLEGVQEVIHKSLERGLREVDYSSVFETVVPPKK